MSKSYKKRIREEDYEEFDEYGELKRRSVDRRKKKRLARALRVKDVDTLVEEDMEEGWGG